MTPNKKIHALQVHILKEIKGILLEESKQLFNDNPSLSSFGWHQYVDVWSRDRYIQFEQSLARPDICGNLGEYIYPRNDTYPLQQKVAEFLKQFSSALLMAAFGDGIDITIYKDGTIETDSFSYDTNRPMAHEL